MHNYELLATNYGRGESLLTPICSFAILFAPPQPTATVHERKRYEVALRISRIEIAPVKPSPRVLIVDASRESREVLRMLLELRGATTIEADDPEQALQITDTVRPDLILFDADSDATSTGTPTNELRAAATRNHTPIVILGKLRQLHDSLQSGQIVTKPYHYGPLIRKIDGLLAAA